MLQNFFTFKNGSKTSLALGVLLLVFSQFSYAQTYTPFSVLGTSQALCKPGIESAEQLQVYFANNPETVKQVLQDANWQGNANDLFSAIAAGKFTASQYVKGSKFEWTGLKKKGKGATLPNRIWANDKPFQGFEVNFTSQCMQHKMVIPNACCNLSLASSSIVAKPVAPKLTIESSDQEATICSESGKDVTLTQADGTSKAVKMNDVGCWTGAVVPGILMASAKNQDQCGETITKASHTIVAAPDAMVAVAPVLDRRIIPFAGVFLGGESRLRYEPVWEKYNKDSSSILGVKAGLMRPISDTVSLFTQIGYLNRDDASSGLLRPGDTVFLDVGADKRIGEKGFLGGGLGYFDIQEDEFSDLSLFVHGGSSIAKSNAQWFIEGRVFGDELDDIENNNLVTGGLRYLFK